MSIQSVKKGAVFVVTLSVIMMLGLVFGSAKQACAAGVSINNGATVTNYAQVNLTFTPPAAAVQMSFANDINDPSAYSAWESVASSKQWTLSNVPVSGPKTVYVRFKNSSNRVISIFSGSILLDFSLDTSYTSPGGLDRLALPAGFSAVANGLAIDSLGRKVLVGTLDRGAGNTDLAVVRYLADGTLDSSFNGNGKFTFGGSYADTGRAIAIQPDGKIVAVGSIDEQGFGLSEILVVRINDNGTLDSGFNSAPGNQVGVVVYSDPIPGFCPDSANAVTLQGDGKILVAGSFCANGSSTSDSIVLRINSTGTLDTTFGTPFSTSRTGSFVYGGFFDDAANGIAVQPDGKIVVVGTYDQGAGNTDAWIYRLDGNGDLDTTFGALNGAGPSRTGDVAYGDVGTDSANAVALQNGKIVVVGTYDWTGGDTDIWVLQLNADGTPDTGFNGNGTVTFGEIGADVGNAVVIQGSTIVVAGTYDNQFDVVGNTSVWVNRLNFDGTQDATFNYDSDYIFGASGLNTGSAVALQADGKIFVAGSSNVPGFDTMLTLRLFGSSFPLTVSTVGSGTVSVFPGALNNGTANYLPGTIVQLNASPTGGATFIGWSGDCSGTGVCSVTMSAARNVTATFTLPSTLSVTVYGTGTVAASSSQGNLVCTSNCNADFPFNTLVTLTATPAWDTHFTGWSGACTGNGLCSFTMNQSQSVSALFEPNLYVRLNGTTLYSTLYDAYIAGNNAGATALIEVQSYSFPENLQFNKPVITNLKGGYNATYGNVTGFTTVNGTLHVSNGRLNASNVIIKP